MGNRYDLFMCYVVVYVIHLLLHPLCSTENIFLPLRLLLHVGWYPLVPLVELLSIFSIERKDGSRCTFFQGLIHVVLTKNIVCDLISLLVMALFTSYVGFGEQKNCQCK